MAKAKSVLIIGGSGFVGTHLALRLREERKVFATYFKHRVNIPGVTGIPFDLTNEKWTKQVIYAIEPDIVIFVAGDHDPEAYEDKDKLRIAERIFAAGPMHSANAVHMMGSRYFYISSCHVFDGLKGNYKETDLVTPDLNFGKSKVGGENFVKSKSSNYVIFRPSPLIGRGNGTNLSWMDKLRMSLDRGKRVELPNDHLYSFATASGFADMVSKVIDSGIRNKNANYGGLTKATWLDLGVAFAKKFGYDVNLLTPKRRKDGLSDEEARRDLSLNSTQAANVLKLKPLFLEESLDLIEKQLISGL